MRLLARAQAARAARQVSRTVAAKGSENLLKRAPARVVRIRKV